MFLVLEEDTGALIQFYSYSRISIAILLYLISCSSIHAGINQWTKSGPGGDQITTIEINPSNENVVYVGTIGSGVYQTTNGGANWSAVNSGLPQTYPQNRIYDIAIDSNNTLIVYAVTGSGIYKSVNEGSLWNATGLAVGSSRSIVIDPVNASTLYAAGTAGIQKSTDGGDIWGPVNNGLLDPFQNITATIEVLAIDPTNNLHLLAGSNTPYDPGIYLHASMFETFNGGTTWSVVDPSLTWANDTLSYDFNAIVFDTSTTPVSVYASNSRVYKSTAGGAWTSATFTVSVESLAVNSLGEIYVGKYNDGIDKLSAGATSWTTIDSGLTSPDVYALSIAPNNDSIIYAGGNGGVFKSTDAGNTWKTVNNGMDQSNVDVTALVFDQINGNNVYAGTSAGGIVKSTDGGVNWTAYNASFNAFDIMQIVVHPVDPSILYLASGFANSRGVFRSANGGVSWISIGASTHIEAIAIDPTVPSTLYAAMRGGSVVLKTTNADNPAVTWVSVQSDLTDNYAYALAVDPQDNSIVYAGTSGYTAVHKSTNGGGNWLVKNTGLDGVYTINDIVFDPTNSNTVYGLSLNGYHKSVNGGETWTTINNGIDNSSKLAYSLAIHPANNNVLYAGTISGVYKSIDAGALWFPIKSGMTSFNTTLAPRVFALAIKPDDPSVLLAGTFNNGLYRLEQQTDLLVSLSANVNKVVAGGSVNYSLSLDNLGPNAATNVELSYSLPNGAVLVNSTPSQGTCGVQVGNSVTCDLGVVNQGVTPLPSVDFQLTLNGTGIKTTTGLASDAIQRDLNQGNNSTAINVAINVPPIAVAPVVPTTVDEDNFVTVTVSGNDPDSSVSLNYTLVTATSNGVLSGGLPNVVYTPNSNYFGADSFSFSVNDGFEDSTVQTVNINVQAVNDGPTAVPDTQTIAEDDTVNQASGNLLANDTDIDTPNAQLSIQSIGAITTVGQSTQGLYGTLTWLSANQYGYAVNNSNASVDSMNNGDILVDNFMYTMSDGSISSSSSLAITITGINDAPTTVADMASIRVGAAQNTVSGNVILNDNDVDSNNSLIHVTAVNASSATVVQATYGTISWNLDGSFVYTLDNENTNVLAIPFNEELTDVISYTASDGNASSDGQLNIVIIGANQSPLAEDIDINLDEDSQISGTFLASDAEQDAISYTIMSQPSKGVVQMGNNTSGEFSYIPNKNEFGLDQFTYVANDGGSDSNISRVRITIAPINDRPEVFYKEFDTQANTTLTQDFPVLDPDGDSLTYTVLNNPEKGSIEVDNDSGKFTYRPKIGSSGLDEVQFIASDGEFDSETGSFVLNISVPGNRSPSSLILVSPSNGINELPTQVTLKWLSPLDPDGDPIYYRLRFCDSPDFQQCNPINIASLDRRSTLFAGISGAGSGLLLVGLVGFGRRKKYLVTLGAIILIALMNMTSCSDAANQTSLNGVQEISYTMTDLTQQTTYYWKIMADDGKGGTIESDTWSFITENQ